MGRFDGYYISFDPTGEEAIDNVLSAVARGGKAFHLTEDWHETLEPYEATHRGTSVVEWIQNAAVDGAAEIRQLRAENARLRRYIAELYAAAHREPVSDLQMQTLGVRHDVDPEGTGPSESAATKEGT